MAFIGNAQNQQGYSPAVDYFSGNGTTTAFSLTRPVATTAQIIASVGNVILNPGSGFSVSGNTITFVVAPAVGSNNVWVQYTSPITQVIAPSPGTVGDSAFGSLNKITYNNSQTLGSGNSSLMKNRLINGGFTVDQRNVGAAQTITTSVAYTCDRWIAYTTGANATGQVVTGTGNNQNNYRFTGATSVTGINFCQRIEATNCYDMAGQTATLSCNLSNSLLTTVTWTAYYAGATDNWITAATQFATGTFTVNSTLNPYSATFNVPSAATTGILIIFSVGAQTSGTWTIGTAQFEVGSAATSFEYMNNQQLFAWCQRYYETGVTSSDRTAAGATSTFNTNFQVQKRVNPTVTYSIYTGQNPTAAGAVFTTKANQVGNSNGSAVGDYTIWTYKADAEL